MQRKAIFIFFILLFCHYCFAQTSTEYKTWNPVMDSVSYIEGQAWTKDLQDPYDRFPARAEKQVRKAVWDLSKNSAGLQLHFRTDATEILIKYVVKGTMQMPHMPATGVSGVDLYAKDADGKWLWSAGKYTFGDTITYRFTNLISPGKRGREYTLYMPLYNSVKWMEVSVPKNDLFIPILPRQEKPIIVYGTSIAQGACATRPGLAWTNILSRKLDLPFINLAFSGNGKLEQGVLDLIAEKDAKLYVLDCLPNLTSNSTSEVKSLLVNAINFLKKKRPEVPILLTEHDGYTDEGINLKRSEEFQNVNIALKEVYDSLSTKGAKNIYILTKEEINQDIESMVDGVHPNDIGMMNYANAYEKKYREIFKEPTGRISTTIPVSQYRDVPTYFWNERHEGILEYNRLNQPKLIFIGNSITHYWAGQPVAPRVNGADSWRKYFESKSAANLGMGWDRIENVLWRVYHGELDSISPQQIVVMIGTNNLEINSNEEIAEGIRFLLKAIQEKQPQTNILLMGLLPRRGMEERIVELNLLYAKIAKELQVQYADAGNYFLTQNKKINEELFSDGLHPNASGYEKLGKFINNEIKK